MIQSLIHKHLQTDAAKNARLPNFECKEVCLASVLFCVWYISIYFNPDAGSIVSLIAYSQSINEQYGDEAWPVCILQVVRYCIDIV